MSDWFSELLEPGDSETLLARNDPPRGTTTGDAPQGAALGPTAPGSERKLIDPLIKGCEECGIRGVIDSKQYRYTVDYLRKKIAEAAKLEWTKWHPEEKPQWEREPKRFGDLVEYWLAPTEISNNALESLRGKFRAIVWKDIPLAESAAGWDAEIGKQAKNTAAQQKYVNTALLKARKSHFDFASTLMSVKMGEMAWSAAFVVMCVRSVEMDHGVVDKDWLLARKEAHYWYTFEAKKKPINRYQTIELTEKVKVGDIIVQDRAPAPSKVMELSDVTDDSKKSKNTHGDIVVEVNDDHAITIGGNIEFEPDFDQSGSVRQRKFPLKGGVLVIQDDKHYEQENDEGKLVRLREEYFQSSLKGDYRTKEKPYNLIKAAPPIERKKSGLHPQSTRRIFALLRLIDDCKLCAEVGASFGR